MAISLLDTITVNLTLDSIQNFSLQPLEGRATNLFLISPTPILSAINYGYVLIVPRLRIDGSSRIVPKETQYYPRGSSVEIPIYNPYRTNEGAQADIGILPIQRYDGSISPQSLDFQLFREQDVAPGIGYPVH